MKKISPFVKYEDLEIAKNPRFQLADTRNAGFLGNGVARNCRGTGGIAGKTSAGRRRGVPAALGERMRDGRLVTTATSRRVSLSPEAKRHAVPPGARNRSQINVARAVSSRLARVSVALPPYKDNIPGRVSIILFRRVRYRSRPPPVTGSLFSTILSRTRPSRPPLVQSDFSRLWLRKLVVARFVSQISRANEQRDRYFSRYVET